MQNATRRAFLQFSSRQNVKNRAYCLPDDILTGIFSRLDIPQIIAVSHVCRPWRASALGCPTLWTAVELAPTFRGFSDIIARSRPVPLQLHMRIDVRNFTSMCTALFDCMDRVTKLCLTIHSLDFGLHIDPPEYTLKVTDAFQEPAPLLRELRIHDAQLQLHEFDGELFGGDAPALQFFRFHGDLTAFPLGSVSAFEHVSHIVYDPISELEAHSPTWLPDLSIDFPSLSHFFLKVPAISASALLYPDWLPATLQHLELRLFQNDFHLPDLLDIFRPDTIYPLLVVALHAPPCGHGDATDFIEAVAAKSPYHLTDLYVAYAPTYGVATIATLDAGGHRCVFADFPSPCRPPSNYQLSLTSLSIGDTYWTTGALPTMPALESLEVHLSTASQRRIGSVFTLPMFAGFGSLRMQHLLQCPLLRSLTIVARAEHRVEDRTLACHDVLMFVRLRLAFSSRRLEKLIMHHTLFSDSRPTTIGTLSTTINSIVYENGPWSWPSRSSFPSTSTCTLPLIPGSCRSAHSVFDSPWN